MKFWLSNEEETRQAGAALAATLMPLTDSGPVVVFVRGNLGAGKSTFVRGFLSRVGVTGVMPSPTYSLVEPYQSGALNVFHMDAYRIADGAELDYLGLDEVEQPGSILLVEWPDHVRDELPAPTAIVDLEMSPHPNRYRSGKSPDRRNPAKAHDGHRPTRPGSQPEDAGGPAPDRHSSGSQNRHLSGIDLEPDQDASNPVAMGRLLTLTLKTVPVQIMQQLSSSKDWHGLSKVVT